MLKFWRVGEDGSKKPKDQDLRKSVMLAVGRVHLQQRIQNKEDFDEDMTDSMTETARSARPPSARRLPSNRAEGSSKRIVKFGDVTPSSSSSAVVRPAAASTSSDSATPAQSGSIVDSFRNTSSGSLLGLLFGGGGGAREEGGRTAPMIRRRPSNQVNQVPAPSASVDPPNTEKLSA